MGETTKNAIRCYNAVDSINSLLSAFPLLVVLVQYTWHLCWLKLKVGAALILMLMMATTFLLLLLYRLECDKQEPTNVFVDKPKCTEELSKWIHRKGVGRR